MIFVPPKSCRLPFPYKMLPRKDLPISSTSTNRPTATESIAHVWDTHALRRIRSHHHLLGFLTFTLTFTLTSPATLRFGIPSPTFPLLVRFIPFMGSDASHRLLSTGRHRFHLAMQGRPAQYLRHRLRPAVSRATALGRPLSRRPHAFKVSSVLTIPLEPYHAHQSDVKFKRFYRPSSSTPTPRSVTFRDRPNIPRIRCKCQ